LKLLLTTPKGSAQEEVILGYSDYRRLKPGQTVAQYYAERAGLYETVKAPDGTRTRQLLGPEAAMKRAHVMIGVLFVAALFWATGAVPIGSPPCW
jgi:solute carrier family 13 (sodium-dependent dicarboxylate transporter), member 2/3/5